MSKSGNVRLRLTPADAGDVVDTDYDVLVAGAGPAGSIAARSLAQGGLRVLMLDRLRSGAQPLGESLPGAARRLLLRVGLGAAAAFDQHHAAVAGSVVAWGTGQPVATDAMRDPYGPGLRLDRQQFDAALRQAALVAGVNWSQTALHALHRNHDHWVVQRDEGVPVRARTLIDATGRAARVLRHLRIDRHKGVPLVAMYQAAWPEKNAASERTLIEALPDGWIYAGRLSDGRWAIGHHLRPQAAAALQRHRDRQEARLASAPHLSACLGVLEWTGPVQIRDARSIAAAVPCGPGWFAVGDAALAFDPVAGQGLFNALRTGVAAAKAILGEPDQAAAYRDEVARVATVYAQRRQMLYASEQRWPEHAFWREQQASR